MRTQIQRTLNLDERFKKKQTKTKSITDMEIEVRYELRKVMKNLTL